MKKSLSPKRAITRLCILAGEVSRDLSLVTLGSHALLLYWCCYYVFSVKWQTLAFACLMFAVNVAGIIFVTLHYKRRYDSTPRLVKYLLICMFATAGQMSIVQFVRTYRKHKYDFKEDTIDKDEVHVSDITNDDLMMLYERYVVLLNIISCVVFPTCVAATAWGETWQRAAASQAARYLLVTYPCRSFLTMIV